MNKYFLKIIRDNTPEFLKYTASGFARNKLVKNEVFQEFDHLLENRKLYSSEFLKNYQIDQLKRILEHANRYVPYYRELFKKNGFNPETVKFLDDIKVLPHLTKQIIQENFDKLISTKETPGGYYKASTGGSTGQPLKLLHDYNSLFSEKAFIYSYRKANGYHLNDRIITFRGIDFKGKMWKYNPIYNELTVSPFILSKKTIKQFLQKIDSFKPKFLNGYSSSIYLFAKLMEDKNLKLNSKLKGIFLTSENIKPEERDFIENYLKAPTSAFYGHTERCVIAYEVEKNIYNFDPFYGYTEFEENDDGSQKIIGTGFLSQTMPMIRYKTDDSCIEKPNGYKIIGKRESSIGLYGKNMEFFAHTPFKFSNGLLKEVLHYQFIQKEIGKAKMLIIPKKNFTSHDIQTIQKEINKKTSSLIDLEVEVTEKLILSPSGKFSMFINKVGIED